LARFLRRTLGNVYYSCEIEAGKLTMSMVIPLPVSHSKEEDMSDKGSGFKWFIHEMGLVVLIIVISQLCFFGGLNLLGVVLLVVGGVLGFYRFTHWDW